MNEIVTSYDEAVSKGNGHRSRFRRDYYWISAIEKESGRLVVLGPYDTEDEANQVGFGAKLDGNFEVHQLGTIDKARATSEIKYKRFNQTKSLEQALRRAKHTV